MKKLFLIVVCIVQAACSSAPTATNNESIQDITAKPRSQEAIQKETPTDEERSCKHSDTEFRCVQYVRNYDADTVTFDIPNVPTVIGKEMPIRLFGIDAPEIKSSNECERTKAREAQHFVQQLLSTAKRIDLVDIGREKYFRLLAKIKIDGRDLTESLIQKGFGYAYYGETKQNVDWCKPLK